MTEKKHAPAHDKKQRAKHHAVAIAAAVEPIHDDIHETDAAPSVLTLSDDEQKLVASLKYLSEYELEHLRKASPDVADAFDANALAAIEQNAALGGKARADEIRAEIDEHGKLTHVASVLAPLVRLVGQGLIQRSAALAQFAGETLKVANGVSRSQPHLVEQLSTLTAWTRAHHAGGHKKPPTPPAGS